MNELIKITKESIGSEEVNAVDARELHAFLGSKQQFGNWIINRIKQYGFIQGVDFTSFKKIIKREIGSTTMIEYIVSLDMAKELSMVERNAKGKQARQYFIEMQRKAESIIQSVEHIDYTGNINDLVFSKDGVAYTNTRIIAEKFNKEHWVVLRAIRDILNQSTNSPKLLEFNANNFVAVEYMDKKQEVREMYEVSESGFALVALGFTGKQALEFKVDFITAFTQMKTALINRFKAEAIRGVLPENMNNKRQYVYIIGSSDTDFIKIGVSNNVEKRLAQLQTGSWAELSVLYRSMVCSNAFNIEAKIHAAIQEQHVRGEWYDIPVDKAISLIENENTILDTDLLSSYYAGDKAIFRV